MQTSLLERGSNLQTSDTGTNDTYSLALFVFMNHPGRARSLCQLASSANAGTLDCHTFRVCPADIGPYEHNIKSPLAGRVTSIQVEKQTRSAFSTARTRSVTLPLPGTRSHTRNGRPEVP